ncbi:CDP-glycerol glycerophosphotransferase family protein [Microbacterium esteraromaticum]|uniref:CDP-glycerol glycerophosphotransferase family protein n=1 Tax=Microbacterium esteraromaticum TaxID=57043 RepID=UPI0015CA7DF1|nr:CDP-glycerol glycerophosphotransferase family protein [Microbacterium esteraromaticum]MBN8425014.1 CDP-glycerol glycerophosphotransferase family protein [Microbacterium esteraromaticum]
MMSVARRLRLDVLAAYAARFALTVVSVVMRVLPRRHKVTLLTRQSSTPPSDFRLLREAMLRTDPSVEVVMIARMVPPGIVRKFAYAAHLLVEMYHASTSRVLVVDGYSIIASATPRSEGLTVVQLWHALGALKKFGLSIVGQRGGRDPLLAKAMRMHAGYDIVIASAERCREPFAEAFGADVSKVVVAPLPRVDRLRDPARRAAVRERFTYLYPELTGKRLALFAPTVRTEGSMATIDPVELTRAMADAGYATITKLHPLVPVPVDSQLRVAPGLSTQDLLLIADLFITDYSSAVFEAAVAEVPSYLIAPDLDAYTQRRDFYLTYPEDLGLPMAHTIDELVEMVRHQAAHADMMVTLRENYVAVTHEQYATAADELARVVLGTDVVAHGRDKHD